MVKVKSETYKLRLKNALTVTNDYLEDKRSRHEAKFENKARKIEELKEDEKKAISEI